jgi:hypothetical protein
VLKVIPSLFMSDNNDILMDKIFEFLKEESVEHIYILKNNRVICHKIGDSMKVSINDNEQIKIKNNTLIHNHPGRFSFSFTDVYNIIKYDAKQMFLVTNVFIYHVQRPLVGWNIDLYELENLLTNFDNWANEEIEKLVIKNEISIHEADFEKSHYIWVTIFSYYGVTYTRKKI